MTKPEEHLRTILDCVPQLKNKEWDAKKCIQEMKDNGYTNWAQTEWAGWFLGVFIGDRIEDAPKKEILNEINV